MADEKILENEKLDEEQLEQVAGGLKDETHTDKAIMFNKGFLRSPQANDDELKMAFYVRYGIIANVHGGNITKNKYTLPDGRTVDHGQVWAYIAATGR